MTRHNKLGPQPSILGSNIINSGPRHKYFIYFETLFLTQYPIQLFYDVPYNRVFHRTIRFQRSDNFIIRLYTSLIYLSCVCMTCSMNLARNPKTEVTVMCLYWILLWKGRHPVQYWSIMEVDTKNINISNIAHDVWNNISNIASLITLYFVTVTSLSVDTVLTNANHLIKSIACSGAVSLSVYWYWYFRC